MTPRTRWLLGTAVAAIGAVRADVDRLCVALDVVDRHGLGGAGSARIDYGVTHPGWVTAWDVFCTVLGPNIFRLAGLVVVVVALWRRNWRLAVFMLITAGLSADSLVELAKYVAAAVRGP